MNILITGGRGFTGKAIAQECNASGHKLRLMGRKSWTCEHETFAGDVSSYESCREAVRGMDAVIICHMAPWSDYGYDNPEHGFDINVKGTANLFHACVEEGIKKISHISSIKVVLGHGHDIYKTCDMPLLAKNGLYPLTKILEENIAQHYQHFNQLQVSIFRPASIIDGESKLNKNGDEDDLYREYLVDRYDLGKAVVAAIECNEIEYDIFYPQPAEGAELWMDTTSCFKKLKWNPVYRFKKDS